MIFQWFLKYFYEIFGYFVNIANQMAAIYTKILPAVCANDSG